MSFHIIQKSCLVQKALKKDQHQETQHLLPARYFLCNSIKTYYLSREGTSSHRNPLSHKTLKFNQDVTWPFTNCEKTYEKYCIDCFLQNKQTTLEEISPIFAVFAVTEN